MGRIPPQGCEWAHLSLGLQLFLNRPIMSREGQKN